MEETHGIPDRIIREEIDKRLKVWAEVLVGPQLFASWCGKNKGRYEVCDLIWETKHVYWGQVHNNTRKDMIIFQHV